MSSAVLWGWMLEKMYGAVNIIMAGMGIQRYFFLGNGVTAMLAIILADAWIRVPLSVLVLYAGLQRVPESLIEAATIDWARPCRCSGTSPSTYFIRPEISMVLILLTMFAWREFSLPWTMTGGGPENLTEIFGITIYKQANLYLRYGHAAAISLLLGIPASFGFGRLRSALNRIGFGVIVGSRMLPSIAIIVAGMTAGSLKE